MKKTIDKFLTEWRALPETEREATAREGLKAMMLAPTLAVYEALMRGESVPEEKLDPNGVQRLGRKKR